VQYPAGARVTLANEAIVAARANRLIYVNDTPNREMNLSPGLGRLLDDADLFLVSGLNSVQDPDTLDARLSELRTVMGHLPDTSMVVFEDAGYHAPQARTRVRDALIDRIDVYSMNEDELEDLLGHQVDLLDPVAVAAAVRELTHLVSAPTVVVHTQYWSLAAGVDPERFRPALQSGVSTAGARYLHADNVTRDDLDAMNGRERHPTGAALARAIEDLMPGSVCCVPAYALSPANPTTVGLGDAFVGGFIAGVVDGWAT
jgi:ADP-dependent phosphofructokinase/glucokinase